MKSSEKLMLTSDTMYAMICMALTLALMLATSNSMADIPTDSAGLLPDAVNGEDSITRLAQIFEIVIKLIAGALVAFSLIIPLNQIIKQFKERKMGDNDVLVSTSIYGVAIMAVGVTIAVIIFGYAGGIAAQLVALG